jgi:hypothetical protein
MHIFLYKCICINESMKSKKYMRPLNSGRLYMVTCEKRIKSIRVCI